MTFMLLDPNLTNENGHHLNWDMSIAAAAEDAGEKAIILANRRCTVAPPDVKLIPYFSCTTYASGSIDRFAAAYDNFERFNQILNEELNGLGPIGPTHGDVVLVPTVSEIHLLGYVRWAKSFPTTTAPRVVVHLMLPSGVELYAKEARVIDPLRVLFYRLAFREAEEEGPPIHFFGTGEQIAAEYSEIAGFRIEPHPIPLLPNLPSVAENHPPTALISAGDAKEDKGFLLIPSLVDALCEKHPDWTFIVHANVAIGGAKIREAFDALRQIARHKPNLIVIGGRLSTSEWQGLLERCSCFCAAYDPATYKSKSSAILWECVGLGIPLLVPAHTWLEREAALWGAGWIGFEGHRITAIINGFEVMLSCLARLKESSTKAAQRYRLFNGPRALIDQIMTINRLGADIGAARHQIVSRLGLTPVRAEQARLAQRIESGSSSYLDIVVQSVRAGRDSWPRLKFKIARTLKGPLLEFRKAEGWPEMFDNWPSTQADRFGLFVRLGGDPEAIWQTVQQWQGRRDRTLLAVLAKLLPGIIRDVMNQPGAAVDEHDLWIANANAISEQITCALERFAEQ